MDAVTAVSGSGPAYVFALAEAMEDAARAQGLADDAARQMVEEHRVGVVFSNGVPISIRDVGKSDGADIRIPPGDLSQCDFRMMIDPMVHDDVLRFGFRKDSGASEDVALEGVDKQEESPAD